MKKFLLLVGCLIQLGCTNMVHQNLFEKDQSIINSNNSKVSTEGRSTVYFIRKMPFLNGFGAPAVPTEYYALNNQLISEMPIGSYVILSLEPGQHKFTRITHPCLPLRGCFRAEIFSSNFNLAPNKTYYIGGAVENGKAAIVQFQPDAGKEILSNAKMAKFIHQPLSIENFIYSLNANERPYTEKKSQISSSLSQTKFDTSKMKDALPSSEQIASFLEVLATVAFIAVVVVALAASGAGSGVNPPSAIYADPPAIHSPSQYLNSSGAKPYQTPNLPSLQTSSGSVSKITNVNNRPVIKNNSSAVSYSMNGNRITGTDGSGYTVTGSSMFSDTGQAYQVFGNQVTSSDGRSCLIAGSVVHC